jgi:hypothetical protein
MRHDNEVDETALFDADEFEAPEELEAAEEPHPAAPAPGQRRDRPFTAAAAVAVVFALLSVVLVVLLVRQRDENKADGDRTTVQTTASRVAEALVSVDANGGQGAAGTVRELGTGPLIQQFDEANAAVRGTFGPLKITSITGRVKEVYLKEIEGSEADVIVVLDLVIVGDNPRVDQDHYLRVHLAKLSGAWKVDNVQDVNLALAGGVQGAGTGAAPTPTAPAASAPPETSSSSP